MGAAAMVAVGLGVERVAGGKGRLLYVHTWMRPAESTAAALR